MVITIQQNTLSLPGTCLHSDHACVNICKWGYYCIYQPPGNGGSVTWLQQPHQISSIYGKQQSHVNSREQVLLAAKELCGTAHYVNGHRHHVAGMIEHVRHPENHDLVMPVTVKWVVNPHNIMQSRQVVEISKLPLLLATVPNSWFSSNSRSNPAWHHCNWIYHTKTGPLQLGWF